MSTLNTKPLNNFRGYRKLKFDVFSPIIPRSASKDYVTTCLKKNRLPLGWHMQRPNNSAELRVNCEALKPMKIKSLKLVLVY
jgi:hypothetical protein